MHLAPDAAEFRDADPRDVVTTQCMGAQPAADDESAGRDCQLRPGPPRHACKREQSDRGNASEDAPGGICDYGHNGSGHRETQDSACSDSGGRRTPLSLLHDLLTPSNRGESSYPQALSPMGMNHNDVIG